jgi:hypothetical protein
LKKRHWYDLQNNGEKSALSPAGPKNFADFLINDADDGIFSRISILNSADGV